MQIRSPDSILFLQTLFVPAKHPEGVKLRIKPATQNARRFWVLIQADAESPAFHIIRKNTGRPVVVTHAQGSQRRQILQRIASGTYGVAEAMDSDGSTPSPKAVEILRAHQEDLIESGEGAYILANPEQMASITTTSDSLRAQARAALTSTENTLLAEARNYLNLPTSPRASKPKGVNVSRAQAIVSELQAMGVKVEIELPEEPEPEPVRQTMADMAPSDFAALIATTVAQTVARVMGDDDLPPDDDTYVGDDVIDAEPSDDDDSDVDDLRREMDQRLDQISSRFAAMENLMGQLVDRLTSEPKPEAKPEPKPEPKPKSEAQAKSEAKSEAKPSPRKVTSRKRKAAANATA